VDRHLDPGQNFWIFGWQVTLCHPIWQVMLSSSEMGFLCVPFHPFHKKGFFFALAVALWIDKDWSSSTIQGSQMTRHIESQSLEPTTGSVTTLLFVATVMTVIAADDVWLGNLMVTCRTCNPEVTQRRRFDSAPRHCWVTTLGKLFSSHTCLCHQAA